MHTKLLIVVFVVVTLLPVYTQAACNPCAKGKSGKDCPDECRELQRVVNATLYKDKKCVLPECWQKGICKTDLAGKFDTAFFCAGPDNAGDILAISCCAKKTYNKSISYCESDLERPQVKWNVCTWVTEGAPNEPPGPKFPGKTFSLCELAEHEMGHLQHCADTAETKPLGDCSLPFKTPCQMLRCEVLAYDEQMTCCQRPAKKPEGCATDAVELCNSMFAYCRTYRANCGDDAYKQDTLDICNKAWKDVCQALAKKKRTEYGNETEADWTTIEWGEPILDFGERGYGEVNGSTFDTGGGLWNPPQCCKECENATTSTPGTTTFSPPAPTTASPEYTTLSPSDPTPAPVKTESPPLTPATSGPFTSLATTDAPVTLPPVTQIPTTPIFTTSVYPTPQAVPVHPPVRSS